MTRGTLKRSRDWADWIKGVRLNLGLNRREFSEILDCSPSYVSRWERHAWVPAYSACEQISKQLDLDKWEVLKRAGYARA